jgi:hypothetical protein
MQQDCTVRKVVHRNSGYLLKLAQIQDRLFGLAGTPTLLNDVVKSSVVLGREVEKETSRESSGPRIADRCAAGRPAKRTNGAAPAVMNGTRSMPEACVPPAFTRGLRPSAFGDAEGRCSLCRTWSDGVPNRS